MITEVITFEIVNPKLNYKAEFVVPNTQDMIDKILTHRFTRQIQRDSVFTVDSLPEFKLPVSFYEIDDEIDEIDQMH